MSEDAVAPVVDPATPPADAAPPAAPLTPAEEEAALDAQLEADAIPLPDGTDKLVPLAAVTTLRGKLKAANTALAAATDGSAKATQLEAEVAALKAQLQEAEPLAQAYKVYARLQEQQPPAPQGPTPEERATLEEIARDELYYDAKGELDLERAKRHHDRIVKTAQQIAQQQVAPMQQQQVQAASRAMLASAKLTKAPNGAQPDPAILDALWARVGADVTATREGAIQVWNVALGMTTATGKGSSAAARDPLPVPLVIERAGGRDTPAPHASESDRRAAKDLGMTVEAYMKEAAEMPQGWGKSSK